MKRETFGLAFRTSWFGGTEATIQNSHSQTGLAVSRIVRCPFGATTFGLAGQAASNCLPKAISISYVGTTKISQAECLASWRPRPATSGLTDPPASLMFLQLSWRDGSATRPQQYPVGISMLRMDSLGF